MILWLRLTTQPTTVYLQSKHRVLTINNLAIICSGQSPCSRLLCHLVLDCRETKPNHHHLDLNCGKRNWDLTVSLAVFIGCVRIIQRLYIALHLTLYFPSIRCCVLTKMVFWYFVQVQDINYSGCSAL